MATIRHYTTLALAVCAGLSIAVPIKAERIGNSPDLGDGSTSSRLSAFFRSFSEQNLRALASSEEVQFTAAYDTDIHGFPGLYYFVEGRRSSGLLGLGSTQTVNQEINKDYLELIYGFELRGSGSHRELVDRSSGRTMSQEYIQQIVQEALERKRRERRAQELMERTRQQLAPAG